MPTVSLLFVVLISLIIKINVSVTTLGGNYNTDKYLSSLESPYILNADIVIESGSSLIINNNVSIDLNSYNIEIDGNITSGCNDLIQGNKRGIISDSNHIMIFSKTGDGGIYIKNGGFASFCNTKFENLQHGIHADGGDILKIDHCIFNLIQDEVLKFYSISPFLTYFITNSIFTNNVGDIASIDNNDNNIIFNNCYFNTFQSLFDNIPNYLTIINSEIINAESSCIEIYDDFNQNVSFNIITNCGSNGITIYHSSNSLNSLLISNNNISQCGEYAIKSRNAQIVIKNNIINNNFNALFIEQNNIEIEIIDNIFIDNSGDQLIEINIDNNPQFQLYGNKLNGNIFINNDGNNKNLLCDQMIYIQGNGQYMINNNIFNNNKCNQFLIQIEDLEKIIMENNQFYSNNLLSSNIDSKLIDISVITTTSNLEYNVTIINNDFHQNTNNDILYINGYHIIHLLQNNFNISNLLSSFILIVNSQSNDIIVTNNNFYSQNNNNNLFDNFIKLNNTSYNITAIDNYFNGLVDTKQISSKLYDNCDHPTLGIINYCPWFKNTLQTQQSINQQSISCHNLECNLCGECYNDNNNNPTSTSSAISSTSPTSSTLTSIQPTVSPSSIITITTLTPSLFSSSSTNTPSITPSITTRITSKPSQRPTLIKASTSTPSMSLSPTITFYGAYFKIIFSNKQHIFNENQQRDIIEILIEIIEEIIDETVNRKECDTNIDFISDNTTFNGTLFVCDIVTERNLRFVFESDGEIKQLEKRLIIDINEKLPEINVNNNDDLLIIIIIEGKTIKNTDNFMTTKVLNVLSSESNNTDKHLLYIMIVSGVLIVAFVIGVIQYCRYERNEIKSQHSLVRDKSQNSNNPKDNPKMKMMGMHQMMNDIKHNDFEAEPGQRQQMLPSKIKNKRRQISICEDVEDDEKEAQKKQKRKLSIEKRGEIKLELIDDNTMKNHHHHHTNTNGNNILVDSDSEHHKTSCSNDELLNEKRKKTQSTETSIDNENETEDEENESVIIEGDDRVITRNMNIAIPETIK